MFKIRSKLKESLKESMPLVLINIIYSYAMEFGYIKSKKLASYDITGHGGFFHPLRIQDNLLYIGLNGESTFLINIYQLDNLALIRSYHGIGISVDTKDVIETPDFFYVLTAGYIYIYHTSGQFIKMFAERIHAYKLLYTGNSIIPLNIFNDGTCIISTANNDLRKDVHIKHNGDVLIANKHILITRDSFYMKIASAYIYNLIGEQMWFHTNGMKFITFFWKNTLCVFDIDCIDVYSSYEV